MGETNHGRIFYILSPTKPAIVRLLNALMDTLNEFEHLPKYLFMIPDHHRITQLLRFPSEVLDSQQSAVALQEYYKILNQM